MLPSIFFVLMLTKLPMKLKTSYTQLPDMFYSYEQAAPFPKLDFALLNSELLKSLGMNSKPKEELLKLFSGQELAEGIKPFAQAYAGHQFGHFTLLGDGRAIVLGEYLNKNDCLFDIQLKGAGQTKYSRSGDGRATLKAMLREYLMSEALHALGIPSSRSLAVVQTGEVIYRQGPNAGALLVRLMKSHIRIGSFEYASRFGDKEKLQALFNYTVKRLYPHLQEEENQALALLKDFMQRQIELVASWLRVGFIHGVMNTDNMALSAETFDYGPCAFLNSYEPDTVYSSIDVHGRYAFANQPKILKWNLVKFAEALLPLIHEDIQEALPLAQALVDSFDAQWEAHYYKTMLPKLGIETAREEDKALLNKFLHLLQEQKLDYTKSFRALSFATPSLQSYIEREPMQAFLQVWKRRVLENSGGFAQAQAIMDGQNPLYIPRNHLVEQALDAACIGAYAPFEKLLAALKQPYAYQEHCDDFLHEPSLGFEESYQTFCGT